MYETFLELLNEKGVKVADVCRETGIRSSTMTDWKKGRYVPKQDKLQKIAEYFNVPVTVFFDKKGSDEKYYQDQDAAYLAQAVLDNPDLHALMDAARDCRPEYIKSAVQLLNTLKETNPDG